MAVGFRSHPFVILTDDGSLPWVAVEPGTGWRSYAARVGIASAAAMDDLANDVSVITELPAMGMVWGGIIIVEAGPGPGTLTIPGAGGGERSFTALLTSFEPIGYLTADGYYQADCEWRLKAEVV